MNDHESFIIGVEVAKEQERILKLIESRICLDSRANGICEHGYCYALTELRAAIKGVELRDE
jgi:hypothetical protein